MINLEHGGDLDRAIAHYGGRKQDWIDLSTGINPTSYPVAEIAPNLLRDLPDQGLVNATKQAARKAYNTSLACIPLAGAQQAIQLFPSIVKKSTDNASIYSPSYNEHEIQLRKAGWQVKYCTSIEEMRNADCAVVVNPNNPDGKQFSPDVLLDLANDVGTLIIDESFCDLYPNLSILPHLNDKHHNIIILRSLGKFYGLAGIRLGFVFAHQEVINEFAKAAGNWAVSGPALAIGTTALTDTNWRHQMRENLTKDALRLDALTSPNYLYLVGGTDLFRLYHCDDAQNMQDRLAQHQIWSRIFSYAPNWIRLGLPPQHGWQRLEKLFKL